MSDYENIIISAVRYALGRMTYIVSITVDYVLKDIEENKLSNKCLHIIKRDIVEEINKDYSHIDCTLLNDYGDWKRLLNNINEVLGDG